MPAMSSPLDQHAERCTPCTVQLPPRLTITHRLLAVQFNLLSWKSEHLQSTYNVSVQLKGKVLPYLLARAGHRADSSVPAVSPQVTLSHPPGGRLPLLYASLPSHRKSPPIGRYQIILLVERGIWVWTTLPKVVTQQQAAGARIRNHWVTSPMP